MRRALSAVAVIVALVAAACGGQASSPLSPSGATVGPTTSTPGAKVIGTVRLGLTAPAVGSSADSMKVEVVGTPILAVVSAAGQFELSNVPPGQARLHFFGAGANAYVTIPEVNAGETTTITVTVVGASAVLESHQRTNQSQQQEIEGRIESLPPTQPAGTLVVAGRTIATDAQTSIRQGSTTKTFADLQIGQRVHVKGTLSGTTFLASLIDIQNTQTDVPVEVNGTVDGLTGNELAFQFTVRGRLVKGDNLTLFIGNSSFSDLRNGARVEVKGQQQDSAVYAVRIHVEDGDDDEEDDEEMGPNVELEGTVAALSGTCPQVAFTLGGSQVVTDSMTSFDRAGCAGVTNGAEVEVKGTRRADGTVLARKVSVEEDEDDDEEEEENETQEYEASGTIGSLSGSCPSVNFMLSPSKGPAVTVRTNTATRFNGNGTSCAGLANGARVEVKGTKQADGSVLATRIKKD